MSRRRLPPEWVDDVIFVVIVLVVILGIIHELNR